MIEPELHTRDASCRGALVWRWPEEVAALSSAAVGGGPARPRWLLNIGVATNYERTDLTAHAEEVALGCGLAGDGVALFTAVDVTGVQRATCEGVVVDATVGLTLPTWAADATAGGAAWAPGTVNLVVQLPVALEPGAAVNAIITATEAKAQALLEAAVPGTGTASDAVAVVWPADGRSATFAGPRSPWGSRIARAVHAAVGAGIGAGS